jgi:hypothetical protein
MYKSSRQTQLITVLRASNKLVTKLHVSAPLSHHQVQEQGLKLVVPDDGSNEPKHVVL